MKYEKEREYPALLIAAEIITPNGNRGQHYNVARMRHLLVFVP